MRTTTLVLLAATALLMTAAGCECKQARSASAAARWERALETACLEAAHESLAQGQYAFARKVLDAGVHSERHLQEAEQMLAQIQEADQMYAQVNSSRNEDEQELAY